MEGPKISASKIPTRLFIPAIASAKLTIEFKEMVMSVSVLEIRVISRLVTEDTVIEVDT